MKTAKAKGNEGEKFVAAYLQKRKEHEIVLDAARKEIKELEEKKGN